jgi:hypothetical protein
MVAAARADAAALAVRDAATPTPKHDFGSIVGKMAGAKKHSRATLVHASDEERAPPAAFCGN